MITLIVNVYWLILWLIHLQLLGESGVGGKGRVPINPFLKLNILSFKEKVLVSLLGIVEEFTWKRICIIASSFLKLCRMITFLIQTWICVREALRSSELL